MSPYNISPLPPQKKTSRRGRPKSSAQVLTSSPCKASLQSSINTKKCNIIPAAKKRGRPKKIFENCEAQTIDITVDRDKRNYKEENNIECIFCNALFSEDIRGEKWIQCLMCEMWAHEECAGSDEAHYICDFCK